MMPWEKQRDWNGLEQSAQAESAKSALKLCCDILGLQNNVEVVGVKDNDRFVLSYTQDPTKPDFARNMIKLEKLMRQTLGVVVDLRLSEKADKNKRFDRNYLRGIEKI